MTSGTEAMYVASDTRVLKKSNWETVDTHIESEYIRYLLKKYIIDI